MIKPRLFLCSGIEVAEEDLISKNRQVVKLDALGRDPNVFLKIEDVARVFLKHLSPRLVDLLEIAAYVYTADCATPRGSQWSDEHSKEAWDRDFEFVIPVRDLDFWNTPKVNELLVDFLEFLANDKYKFQFSKLTEDRPIQPYLDISNNEDWPFYGVNRVLMFSGGLDSLAGAVETAKSGEKLVLVSHRPVASMNKRQQDLAKELRRSVTTDIIHIPVWVNKEKSLGRESTQRTRSFLFSALGAVVAESLRAGGVSFFENGVVSLNLPIADEVLRARASRTTHPKVLSLYSEFYSLLTERVFVVDNPYLFKTKTEVVSILAEKRAEHLIQMTCSCAHTGFFQSKHQWHCGTCSQCIDRRIAVIAAGLKEHDPEEDYVTDVFIGNREPGYSHNMAVDYLRHTLALYEMSEMEMEANFNLQIARASVVLPNRREAAQKLIHMHKRHATSVFHVLEQAISESAGMLLSGDIPESSLISIASGSRAKESSWIRYTERIASLLSRGIPVMCNTTPPDNEPHLQELCDGILRAHNEDLDREFPFLRWGSVSTKPDWSNGYHRLWVELKYVRKKGDIRPITEDIAADITKYGDNNRHVLYIVYDRYHHIIDDREFSSPITAHKGMMVRFIR